MALVPKGTGSNDYTQRFGESISVALEGTFIKQVSLLTLSPSSLTFGAEYISPDTFSVAFGKDIDIAGMQAASPSQAIQITNGSSSPTTINRIAITSGTSPASSSPSAAKPDFTIVNDQGTCGNQTPSTHTWDPTAKFTIPAHGSCVLYVRSTPQSPGPTTATLSLDGDNIEGTKAVRLAGNGVGFFLDTANLSSARSTFNCSLLKGNCTVDLKLITLTNNKFAVPIFYYLPSGATVHGITVSQDGTPLDTTGCSDAKFPPSSPPASSCTVTLVGLNTKQNAGTTTLSFGIGDAQPLVTFNYALTATQTTITAAPRSYRLWELQLT